MSNSKGYRQAADCSFRTCFFSILILLFWYIPFTKKLEIFMENRAITRGSLSLEYCSVPICIYGGKLGNKNMTIVCKWERFYVTQLFILHMTTYNMKGPCSAGSVQIPDRNGRRFYWDFNYKSNHRYISFNVVSFSSSIFFFIWFNSFCLLCFSLYGSVARR